MVKIPIDINMNYCLILTNINNFWWGISSTPPHSQTYWSCRNFSTLCVHKKCRTQQLLFFRMWDLYWKQKNTLFLKKAVRKINFCLVSLEIFMSHLQGYFINHCVLTMFLGFDNKKCWATCTGSKLKRILLLSSLTFSMPSLSSSA